MDEDEDDLYGNSGPQNGAKEQQDEETMKEEEDNEDGDAVDEDSDSVGSSNLMRDVLEAENTRRILIL